MVANNDKKEKIHKTDYLQDIQIIRHTQWRLRIKLSFLYEMFNFKIPSEHLVF